MLGLRPRCGSGPVRRFLTYTPKALLEELHFRRHSYWVIVEHTFDLRVLEFEVPEEVEVPKPTIHEYGNLTKRQAKKLGKLLEISVVPYYNHKVSVSL